MLDKFLKDRYLVNLPEGIEEVEIYYASEIPYFDQQSFDEDARNAKGPLVSLNYTFPILTFVGKTKIGRMVRFGESDLLYSISDKTAQDVKELKKRIEEDFKNKPSIPESGEIGTEQKIEDEIYHHMCQVRKLMVEYSDKELILQTIEYLQSILENEDYV